MCSVVSECLCKPPTVFARALKKLRKAHRNVGTHVVQQERDRSQNAKTLTDVKLLKKCLDRSQSRLRVGQKRLLFCKWRRISAFRTLVTTFNMLGSLPRSNQIRGHRPTNLYEMRPMRIQHCHNASKSRAQTVQISSEGSGGSLKDGATVTDHAKKPVGTENTQAMLTVFVPICFDYLLGTVRYVRTLHLRTDEPSFR